MPKNNQLKRLHNQALIILLT